MSEQLHTAGPGGRVPAVLGIDPGRRWTAGVLRDGAAAVHGWTLGPVDAAGLPAAAATDNVHDLAAFGRYMARLLDAIETSIAAFKGGGPVRLAVEVVVPPGGRIALADWLIPRQILAGVLTYDPQAVLVAPGPHGKRRPVTEAYPAEFWPAKHGVAGGRPSSWGPCEARRGERDHERAAYDIAGAALAILERGAGAR